MLATMDRLFVVHPCFTCPSFQDSHAHQTDYLSFVLALLVLLPGQPPHTPSFSPNYIPHKLSRMAITHRPTFSVLVILASPMPHHSLFLQMKICSKTMASQAQTTNPNNFKLVLVLNIKPSFFIFKGN